MLKSLIMVNDLIFEGLCHVEHNSNRYRIPKSGIIQGVRSFILFSLINYFVLVEPFRRK